MSDLTQGLMALQLFLVGVFVGQLVALVIWSLPVSKKNHRGSHESKN